MLLRRRIELGASREKDAQQREKEEMYTREVKNLEKKNFGGERNTWFQAKCLATRTTCWLSPTYRSPTMCLLQFVCLLPLCWAQP